jgi:hypothetical protein
MFRLQTLVLLSCVQALNATGRTMLFSLCEWGDDNVLEWGGNVGQMWRVQVGVWSSRHQRSVALKTLS